MDVYEKARLAFCRRVFAEIAINMAKLRFIDDISARYFDGFLTRDEFDELLNMV